jgi:hypothetical protein
MGFLRTRFKAVKLPADDIRIGKHIRAAEMNPPFSTIAIKVVIQAR